MLEAMFTALFAVVPVFLVIGLGVWLRSREVLPDNAGRVLGVYVLRVALPLLLLHLVAQARPEDLAQGGFWLGVLGAQLLMFALAWGMDRLVWRRGRREAVIAGMNASVNNVGFVGLAIIMNLFPGNMEALLVAGLTILGTNLVIGFSQGWLEWLGGTAGGGIRAFLYKFVLGNILILSALVGAVLACSGLGLWEPLDRAVRMVGYTAAPCMLLSLGLDLRQKLETVRRQAAGQVIVRQTWLIGCKLILHPLLCWYLLWLLGVEGLWLSVSVLLSATAAALVNALMAEVYDADPAEAALTVVLSNALNMFSLSAFIWFFLYLGMI
ncbi:MAG: AEC family transporter [Desulfovibrionaceae bacterium]|nr:AEC family transporter [Desulfovibrionaceae bacterium]